MEGNGRDSGRKKCVTLAKVTILYPSFHDIDDLCVTALKSRPPRGGSIVQSYLSRNVTHEACQWEMSHNSL